LNQKLVDLSSSQKRPRLILAQAIAATAAPPK